MTNKQQLPNDFPFIGKWYRVIKGDMAGFTGKCVSYTPEEKHYPIVLQDLNYMSVAVSMQEIEPTMQQPDGYDIDRTSKN